MKNRIKNDYTMYKLSSIRTHQISPICIECVTNYPTYTKFKYQLPVCTLCASNHTANYRGCQIYKDLQRLNYSYIMAKTNTSKPNVNYNQIKNKRGYSSDITLCAFSNINYTTSFHNLTQNLPNLLLKKRTLSSK